MSRIHVSVVICTKNRAGVLRVCLDKFNQLQCQTPWELIVVDNNSTDNTCAVVHEFAPNATMSFRFAQETIPGSSAAKNTGWKLALGEFIAFTDDDCYPEADYIDAVIRGLGAKEAYGFVGGRVLLFDPTDLPITIQTCNTYIAFAPRSFLAAGVIHGANFAFRRAALEAAVGFDIRCGADRKYPCEDVDVMAEILRLGWEGVYDPRLVVYHHRQRKTQQHADKLAMGYDQGRGAYYAKRLIKPNTRWLYLQTWVRKMRWQPLGVTKREIISALIFWWENMRSDKSTEKALVPAQSGQGKNDL